MLWQFVFSEQKNMTGKSSEDVTALLLNWQRGDDEDAPAKLMPLVYEELRRVGRLINAQTERR